MLSGRTPSVVPPPRSRAVPASSHASLSEFALTVYTTGQEGGEKRRRASANKSPPSPGRYSPPSWPAVWFARLTLAYAKDCLRPVAAPRWPLAFAGGRIRLLLVDTWSWCGGKVASVRPPARANERQRQASKPRYGRCTACLHGPVLSISGSPCSQPLQKARSRLAFFPSQSG